MNRCAQRKYNLADIFGHADTLSCFEIAGSAARLLPVPHAVSAAGGIGTLDENSLSVINCVFSGNSAASGFGGGMFNTGNSDPNVTNCTFNGNSADYGGGITIATSSR